MKKRAVLACFLLAACDKAAPLQPLEPEKTPPSGRYVLYPMPGATKILDADRMYAYAWRIDTTTGNVDVCTYAEAPPMIIKGKAAAEITSTACAHSTGPAPPQ